MLHGATDTRRIQTTAVAFILLLIPEASAWTSTTKPLFQRSLQIVTVQPSLNNNKLRHDISIRSASSNNDRGNDFEVGAIFDPLFLFKDAEGRRDLISSPTSMTSLLVGSAALALLTTTPSVASAATTASSSASNAIPTAIFAYGHFLCLILVTACITAERIMVQPYMTIEEENQIQIVDIILGISGVGLLATGYYRATTMEYGKGWAFYSHEPIFWLKMSFLGIFAGLTLFPTIIFLRRTVRIQERGNIEPMSEKLARRLTSVMNAELSALAFIPLTATLMARGVGHINNFPTETVGPALFGVITFGTCYKYVKDALTWTED